MVETRAWRVFSRSMCEVLRAVSSDLASCREAPRFAIVSVYIVVKLVSASFVKAVMTLPLAKPALLGHQQGLRPMQALASASWVWKYLLPRSEIISWSNTYSKIGYQHTSGLFNVRSGGVTT